MTLRGRSRALVPAVLVLAAVGLLGCSSAGTERPATPATLRIVTPAPNAETGPDVDLHLVLDRARLVPGTQIGGEVRPHEGHVHVSVDGRLIAMSYGLEQTLRGLTPGSHTAQAEFVAADHLPFRNRVVAVVTFTVR